MSRYFDRYTVVARIQPALLVALPLALLTLAWVPGGVLGTGPLWGFIVAGGGTALLAQLGRDLGRQKEPKLFKGWGGAPATRKLRHREPENNKDILARHHSKLQELLPNQHIPTDEEELAEPDEADKKYEAVVAFLLEQTRDREKFYLVFEENINYGFRRNLFAMRHIGITTAFLGVLGAGSLIAADILLNTSSLAWYEKIISTDTSSLAIRIISGTLNLVMLVLWILVINRPWVKTAADAYAETLLASCDAL